MNLSVGEAVAAFSVVIPLYNKRPYIRRAVESVLKQSFEDFELIVVDDGSTDGSAEVLADIADRRLRLVRQANQGEGPARNAGLNIARGEWVAFLDADDAWLPCHLQELSSVGSLHPGAGLISTTCVEAVGTELPGLDQLGTAGSVIREVDYFLEASRKLGFINSTSTAVRRVVAAEIGGFTARRTGADLEYWIKVALRYPVAVSDKVTCVYFRDTGGVMQQLQQRTQAGPARALREVSTPVAVIYAEAEKQPDLMGRGSVRRYINGIVQVAIKGALYRGDFGSARRYASDFLTPLTLWQRCLSLLVHCPVWLLRLLLRVNQKLKR